MDRLGRYLQYTGSLLFLTFVYNSSAHAFVLLSGPEEARLTVTPEAPEVSFIYENKSPTINNKEEFEDGKYKELTDEQLFPVILQLAMDQWNAVKGSYLRLKLAGVDDARAQFTGEDRVNSIVFGDAGFSSAALAYPTVEDGKIVDCDIQVATRATSAKSLAYTILHELGHCVGLGHYHTDYGAVMGYSRMSRSLKLGADDMAGEIYLYPDPNAGNVTPKELVNCGVVGASKADASGSAQHFLTMLMMCSPFLIAVLSRFRCQRKPTTPAHATH